MITISVDYQGSRDIEESKFETFNNDFSSKLQELEDYSGKIDSVKIFRDQEKLVDATNVGVAVRRGRALAERATQ